jgi:hypothetical protein
VTHSGEWTGPWGDNTDIRQENEGDNNEILMYLNMKILTSFTGPISKVFSKSETENAEVRTNDGTFFMKFEVI